MTRKELKLKANNYMRETFKNREPLPFEDVYNRSEDYIAGFLAGRDVAAGIVESKTATNNQMLAVLIKQLGEGEES